VHSLKDMPAASPKGLAIGALLPRADPRDLLCELSEIGVVEISRWIGGNRFDPFANLGESHAGLP